MYRIASVLKNQLGNFKKDHATVKTKILSAFAYILFHVCFLRNSNEPLTIKNIGTQQEARHIKTLLVFGKYVADAVTNP